jgi:hypothetical protein
VTAAEGSDPIRCVVCARPGRIPHNPPVCSGCRFGIGDTLRTIPELYALLNPERVSVADGPKVSGSREAPIPIRVDVVDLTLTARNGVVIDGYGDQTGAQSVATILDQWVRDWRDTLWPDHSLPNPTVVELVGWLRNRLEVACDSHPAIDEFAAEVRALRRTLLAALGRSQRSGDYIGRCPTMLRDGRCDTRLYADPYISEIRCPRCCTTWPRHQWLHLAAMQQDVREAS